MITENFIESKLTIKGKEVNIKQCSIRQDALRFYPENPRIYSFISAGSEELTQDDIERKLIQLDHVKQLVQSIKANGGLLDSLIIKEKDNIVVEGNSRLAAYRILARKDPIKWGKIKCTLLPRDIKEDQIFALLGEYHIIGRKDWAPFEQAGYLWRRQNNSKISSDQMSKEMGLSVKKINHLINVYSFMIEHSEVDVQKWSYYEEYLKSNKVKNVRECNPNLDNIVVKRIKSGDIQKATDVRDKLTKVIAAKGNVLKRFLNNKHSLEDCYELVVHRGLTNIIYNKLKRFREHITDFETQKEIVKMPNVHKNKCKYEIKKIKQTIDKLYRKLEG